MIIEQFEYIQLQQREEKIEERWISSGQHQECSLNEFRAKIIKDVPKDIKSEVSEKTDAEKIAERLQQIERFNKSLQQKEG